MKNVKEEELSIEEQVTKDCPLLFRMRHAPCTETSMCWGFECGDGWHSEIAEACRVLEVLNMMFYSKYHVRIQADQIQSEFGTLRFYWSVVADPHPAFIWLANKFGAAYQWMNKHGRFDFKPEKVTDEKPQVRDTKCEISKEAYDRLSSAKSKASNVEYAEEDGKYYEICHLTTYGRFHCKPTRLRAVWHLMKLFEWLRRVCLYSAPKKHGADVRNCMAFLDRQAAKIIRDLEDACYCRCEHCGNQIGTDWSPRCELTGWITYVCDKCAEKSETNYMKNGKLYNGTKPVENTKQK